MQKALNALKNVQGEFTSVLPPEFRNISALCRYKHIVSL